MKFSRGETQDRARFKPYSVTITVENETEFSRLKAFADGQAGYTNIRNRGIDYSKAEIKLAHGVVMARPVD